VEKTTTFRWKTIPPLGGKDHHLYWKRLPPLHALGWKGISPLGGKDYHFKVEKITTLKYLKSNNIKGFRRA